MKKRMVFIFIFSLCVLNIAFTQIYNDENDFLIELVNNETGVRIIGYKGNNSVVNIPSKIQNLPVIEIGESAFFIKTLENVSIPYGVISIAELAFMGNQLTSITIPNSVVSIGNSAFAGNQLESISIPSSLISIGGGVFYNNPIKNIIVSPENSEYQICNMTLMSKDGKLLLAYFGEEKNFSIPDSVTSIGSHAFAEKQFISIIIPNNITSIGFMAFADNQLINITIPSSVTYLGERVFVNNPLTSVTFEKSNMSIDDLTFYTDGGSRNLNQLYSVEGAGTYTRTTIQDDWVKQQKEAAK
jgi:hypothetical protein